MRHSVVEVTELSGEKLLVQAKASLEAGDLKKAQEHCRAYLTEFPDDVVALRLYANIHAIQGDLSEAIKLIDRVISLNDVEEPCDFFYRGRWRLRSGQFDAAVIDFECVIDVSTQNNDVYYLGAAYLHQAIAFFYQGNRAGAISALSHVDEEHRTSVNGIVFSKSYITEHLEKRS